MESVRAIIFDLDGTITEPFFDFDAIRAEMGLAKDAGPVLEAIDKMGPEQRENAKKILDYHERLAVEKSQINPGVRETLNKLRKNGIKIGILTRNTKNNVSAVAEKHGLFSMLLSAGRMGLSSLMRSALLSFVILLAFRLRRRSLSAIIFSMWFVQRPLAPLRFCLLIIKMQTSFLNMPILLLKNSSRFSILSKTRINKFRRDATDFMLPLCVAYQSVSRQRLVIYFVTGINRETCTDPLPYQRSSDLYPASTL